MVERRRNKVEGFELTSSNSPEENRTYQTQNSLELMVIHVIQGYGVQNNIVEHPLGEVVALFDYQEDHFEQFPCAFRQWLAVCRLKRTNYHVFKPTVASNVSPPFLFLLKLCNCRHMVDILVHI